MNINQLSEILSSIRCFDRRFFANPIVPDQDLGWHLVVVYNEADIDTGKMEMQKSRKWFIEPDATETDVVETAFAAAMRSYDHVVQEHFTYKGKRVYSPHFDIGARLAIADNPTGAFIEEWFRVGGVVCCESELYTLTDVRNYRASGGHMMWWGTGELLNYPYTKRTLVAPECTPSSMKNTP